MMLQPNPIPLLLEVHLDPDADDFALDQITRQFRSELEDSIDIESIELVSNSNLPDGVKSADAFTWGALFLTVLPSILPQLVQFIQAWTMRGKERTVIIKTQHGNRALEVQFSPEFTSAEEVNNLVKQLTESLSGK